MINPEQQLQENALKANFTEVQQMHFDKLMSELEVISGGLGFAELKEKAEAGSTEALQVMRDYVAKKEQIVEFIETKKMPDFEANPIVEITEIKVNDTVTFLQEGSWRHGKIGEIKDFFDFGDSKRAKVAFDGMRITRCPLLTLAKIAGPFGLKYGNPVSTEEQLDVLLLETHQYEDFKVGDEFAVKNTPYKVRLIAFVLDRGVVKLLYETIDNVDEATGKYFVYYNEPEPFLLKCKKIR